MFRFIFLFLFVVACSFVHGQTVERIARNANAYFEDNLFEEALPLYLQLTDKEVSPEILTKEDLNFRIGICYINKEELKYEAIPYFEQYIALTKNDSSYEAHYLLGQMYQEKYRFDDALTQYTIFKTFVDKDSISDRQTIYVVNEILKKKMENCNYGKLVFSVPRNVIVENLGAPVNTKYSEYAPVITPDESRLVFTRRSPEGKSKRVSPDGDYYEDVFISEVQEGAVMQKQEVDSIRVGFVSYLNNFRFSYPVPIDNINTASYDGAVQFSYGSDKLFVYRKNNVWISSFEQGDWQKPVLIPELETVLNPSVYEPSVSIAMDGSAIYFSSDRPGGFGGLDLYVSRKHGVIWTTPQNLGPVINTAADEDSPYIDPDNRTLYFSSKGHSSMGGYDVYKSKLTQGAFQEIENMGFPVNSPGDDIFFMMTPKYNRGYYASNKSGGHGKMDIYRLTFADERRTFAEIRGLVLKGDKLVPALSRITLSEPGKQQKAIAVKSDSTNGNYLLLAAHNKKYLMHVETEGFVPYTREIEIPARADFFQYYQEIHHVYITDAAGNVIGQLVTMYTTNGDSVKTDRDTLIDKEYQKAFFYQALKGMDRDSMSRIINSDQALKNRYDAEKDKEKFLFESLSLLGEDDLNSVFWKDPSLAMRIRKARKYGYTTMADAKFYISKDSLQSLIAKDPSLIFRFPKGTTISYFDIRKAKGQFGFLDPSLYIISNEGIESLYKGSSTLTEESLTTIFTSVKESEAIDVPKIVVLFDFKGYTLNEDSKKSLDVFAAFLKKNNKLKFEIIGHTDSIGTSKFNFHLSQARATSVVNYLNSCGISNRRMIAKGKGATQPMSSNSHPDGTDNEEGRKLNRRVEFILIE